MPKPLNFPSEIQTLGQAVRFLRDAKGLTLRGLADKVGVSAPFLSDIEHDRRSTNKLAELADALDATEDDLSKFRLGADLKDWLGQNPALIQLLREMKASDTNVAELRSALASQRRHPSAKKSK